jgi:hypothetical protein
MMATSESLKQFHQKERQFLILKHHLQSTKKKFKRLLGILCKVLLLLFKLCSYRKSTSIFAVLKTSDFSYAGRKRFLSTRAASKFIISRVASRRVCLTENHWYSEMLNATKVSQSWMRAVLSKTHAAFLQKQEAAQDVQSLFWAILVRRDYLTFSRQHVPTLQSFLRTVRAVHNQLRFSTMCNRLLVPKMKTIICNRKWGITRSAVVAIQKHSRGRHLRMLQWKLLSSELVRLKSQLCFLWARNGAPLYYRSSFWLIFCSKNTYLNVSICRDEASSLKKKLALDPVTLRKMEQEDRKNIYLKLKSSSEEFKNLLYEQFGIPVRSKKRKQTLSNQLWLNSYSDGEEMKDFDLEDRSANLVLRIHDDVIQPDVQLRKSERLRTDLFKTVSALLRENRARRI